MQLMLRRNKCDLTKMIKMVHKRSTWGKRYIYASNDEHDIYIEIKSLDFSRGIIFFKVSFKRLYTNYYDSDCDDDIKYHMGDTDDNVEKLTRRVNNAVLNKIKRTLEMELEAEAGKGDVYIKLKKEQNRLKCEYEQELQLKYKEDANIDIVVDALVDKYTKDFWKDLLKVRVDYAAFNYNSRKSELHKQYEILLRNEE